MREKKKEAEDGCVKPDTAVEEDPLVSAIESMSVLGQRRSVKTVSLMRGGDRR